MPKALLIKSNAGSKAGNKGVWHKFDQAQPYIQGIETLIDTEVNADVVNTLVSGVPTPWARARLFELAFKNTMLEANQVKTGLIKFYEILVDEWKGLIACLAIFPSRITLSEPIALTGDERGFFDIPSALGRMLFEDADLWTDPLANDPATPPTIQLIYYNGKLVGATSPYSLLITGTEYADLPGTADMPWYRNGYFQDPMPFLSNDQKQKLFLLLNNIERGFQTFEQQVNSNRKGLPMLDFNGLKEFVHRWKNGVKNTGTNISDEGTLDHPLKFAGIYHPLFNVKQSIYFDQNCSAFFIDAPGGGRTEVDPKTILLQNEAIMLFPNAEGQTAGGAGSAVYFLDVPNPSAPNAERLHFAIPLSEAGLVLFKNRVGDLFNDFAGFHRLHGELKGERLKVTLELKIGQLVQKYSSEYKIELVEQGKSIITWPNFISNEWNIYYLYTEFPTHEQNTHLVPFFKKPDPDSKGDWKYVTDAKGKLLFADSTYNGTLEVQKLVQFPGKQDSTRHRYDILKSSLPVAGLEVRSRFGTGVMGYLVVKSVANQSERIKDLSLQSNYRDVIVGFDFGSNNSCLQYATDPNGGNAEPIPFQNRRVFLVGSEIHEPSHLRVAHPNELYFFQNETPINGQIKSWVHEHHPNYVNPGMDREELAGGVAVFGSNIDIHGMTPHTIVTNAGTLHHSMKWLTSQQGLNKKVAYMQNVWTQACADLYANGYKPKLLRWSYPGAFSTSDRSLLKTSYMTMIQKCPIKNFKIELDEVPLTESEAVSNYAFTKQGIQETNIFLGMDIGGSTTDVLIIAMDAKAQAYKMIKQSSVRLAAKYLADAIGKSSSFQEVLLRFHDSPGCQTKIPKIRTLETIRATAPFYLNALFDRLRGEELDRFYTYVAQDKQNLYAIPAYMSGLLLYTGGQLVGKAFDEHPFLSTVKKVDFFPFGKGGRIFDWLDVFPGKSAALAYYNECFRAGFDPRKGKPAPELVKKDDIREDNKSEVAKGLVAPQRVKAVEEVRLKSDIIGESGYVYRRKGGKELPLQKNDHLNANHFKNFEFELTMPQRFEEFGKFLDIFLRFTKQHGIITNTAALKSKESEIYNVLKGYVTNDPEYLKAQASQRKNEADDFEFKHSMLVLEGMCFLEKFLIPEVYEKG